MAREQYIFETNTINGGFLVDRRTNQIVGTTANGVDQYFVTCDRNPVTGGLTFSPDVLGMDGAQAGDVITFNGVDWLAQAPQTPVAFTDPYISISSRRTELVENPTTEFAQIGKMVNQVVSVTNSANVQVIVNTTGAPRFDYASDGSTLPSGIRGVEMWESTGASMVFNTVIDNGTGHAIGTVGTDAWKTGAGNKFVHPVPAGLTGAQIVTFINALRIRSEAATGSVLMRMVSTPLKWKFHPDSTTEDVLVGAGASQALTYSSTSRYPVTNPTDGLLIQLLGAGDARWLSGGQQPTATYGNLWKSGAMRTVDFADDGIGLTTFKIFLPAGAWLRVRALKKETS